MVRPCGASSLAHAPRASHRPSPPAHHRPTSPSTPRRRSRKRATSRASRSGPRTRSASRASRPRRAARASRGCSTTGSASTNACVRRGGSGGGGGRSGERVAGDRCSTHARCAHYTHTRRLRPRSSRGSSSAHARALLVLARLRSCPLTIDPECSEQRTQAVCALLLSSTPLEWRRFPPLEPKLQAVRAGLQILRFLAIRTCKRAANALRETSP